MCWGVNNYADSRTVQNISSIILYVIDNYNYAQINAQYNYHSSYLHKHSHYFSSESVCHNMYRNSGSIGSRHNELHKDGGSPDEELR